MKEKFYFKLFLLTFIPLISLKPLTYDVTFIGHINPAEGLGSVPVKIIDCIKDTNLKINCISINQEIENLNDLSPKLVDIIKKNDKKTKSNMAIYTSLLWYKDPYSSIEIENYKLIPKESAIKIAYSMFESTEILPEWVNILNKHFDATIVPDPFLVQVYKKSGVNIPIFMIPIPLNLSNFFKKEPKQIKGNPFIFTNTNTLIPRKNYLRLIEAFNLAFGNSSKVQLHINYRAFEPEALKIIQNKINNLNLKNIFLTFRSLNTIEYINFLNSSDCFVSLSRGEGFGLTAREALALSVPVILSNNSAHTSICNSGYVKSIKSQILVPYTGFLFEKHARKIGFEYDCQAQDAAQALKDIYDNYYKYKELAKRGRKWVSQYSSENLKKLFVNFIKPKKVIFSNKNFINEKELITNSPSLYKKYLKLSQEFY